MDHLNAYAGDGWERQRLSRQQAWLCDGLVRLPMVGQRDSLNLAVATGLMLYEPFERRQRLG